MAMKYLSLKSYRRILYLFPLGFMIRFSLTFKTNVQRRQERNNNLLTKWLLNESSQAIMASNIVLWHFSGDKTDLRTNISTKSWKNITMVKLTRYIANIVWLYRGANTFQQKTISNFCTRSRKIWTCRMKATLKTFSSP